LAGLGFLKALAEERAGDVKVFPFRMARGFLELMRGSTYLVMASLYEPFGAATEGYAKGTPVVARATGGLVQQVAPYPSGVMGQAVRRIADRYHARGAAPTGFLFREPELVWEDILAGWEHIVACEYEPGDRVAERTGAPLFRRDGARGGVGLPGCDRPLRGGSARLRGDDRRRRGDAAPILLGSRRAQLSAHLQRAGDLTASTSCRERT
jgi:hypothetical protein